MKERPILFNAEMVRAVLAGTKTQTRRLVKPQPDWEQDGPIACETYHPTKVRRNGEEYPGEAVFGFATEEEGWKSPYGGPGDTLWVRETWKPTRSARSGINSFVRYRADDSRRDVAHYLPGDYEDPWRPSIHMPRWASRITLKVTGVRVSRVQDMSEDDAYDEGITLPDELRWEPELLDFDSKDAFRTLWDSLNTKPGTDWDANPWVWVIEFERLSP